ncbi:hypothetical protein AB0M39_15770 [Streptomyces sp. NPDC051907]|uniref:hypothetical protein n=1 Tax=Streptomyces sp. NPDC051907 TaxID=3155284 RepID=UPI00342517C6
MTRLRTTLAAALLLSAVGCGVRPTGVIDAGEPATGLTTGMRLYFDSPTGLRGVPRPTGDLKNLESVLKMLLAGPSEAEREQGLTTLVQLGTFAATGEGDQVRLDVPDNSITPQDRVLQGQLVCSLARAQSLLGGATEQIRPADVQVTLRPDGPPLGPYRCPDFLTG